MSFSPDGGLLAVSDWSSLVLWHTGDYRQFEEIHHGGGEKLSVLAFSPDGKTLACADDRNAIVLWDVAAGEVSDVLRGHEGRVRTAAFRADGKSLFTGSGDGTILVWDLTTAPAAGHPAEDDRPPGALLRLGDVRFWSKGIVTSLAFSPDGSTLAVAVRPNWPDRVAGPAVRLLEVPSGAQRRRLQKLPASMTAVAFSPDGRSLAGVDYWGLFVWDLPRGTWRHGFAPSKGSRAVAYSPDGQCLAVAEGSAIQLRDAATGQELRRLDVRATRDRAFAFSPDGKVLASSSPPEYGGEPGRRVVVAQGTIRLWDVRSGKCLREIACGDRSFDLLHFSSDGKTLAAWTRNAGVSLRDVETGREIRTIMAEFPAAAFSSDGKLMATGGPIVHLWDLPAGRQIRSFDGRGEMRLLTFSADGRWLAAVDGAPGGHIRLWDVGRGEEAFPYPGHRGSVRSLSVTADGRTLCSTGPDGTVHVWDLPRGCLRRVLGDRGADLQSAAVSADGKAIAAMDAAGAVSFWSAAGEKVGQSSGTAPINLPGRWDRPKPLLAYSAEGRTAFAGRMDGVLRLWGGSGSVRADFAKEPRTLPADEDGGIPVALSPDGALVASIARESRGAFASILRVWRPDSGLEVCRVEAEACDRFWAAAFSPDGKIVATSNGFRDEFHGLEGGYRLLFWGVATGKRFLEIDLRRRAHTLAFSPDGKLLATASGPTWRESDYTVRIWDVTTGKMLEELPGHGGWVNALLFSPDGRRLFSGGDDGLILVWDTRWPHPRPRRPRDDLTAEQLDSAWADLAGEDVARAFRSLSDLAAVPRRSVPFLREHLPAPPVVDRALIARLIAGLDSEDFAVRGQARRGLEEQGEVAEHALRKVLQDRPALEVRRQVEGLLDRLEKLPPSAQRLRISRAVLALEWMDAPEARRLIETLAHGAPEARLTHEAEAAWRRQSRLSPAVDSPPPARETALPPRPRHSPGGWLPSRGPAVWIGGP